MQDLLLLLACAGLAYPITAIMFNIQPATTFTAPVLLSIPGNPQSETIQVTWRHKTVREFAAWMNMAEQEPSDAEFLGQVIVNWSGVGDAQGRPLPYSLAALEQLLDAYPASGQELVRAYRRQLVEARAKN